MLIIGHRGASGTEPENTIGSFKKAESAGADMVEMDIRKSKDSIPVVVHDRSLVRLFGLKSNVADLTVKELKQVSGSREIPTLDEALSSISSDVNLDIKVSGIEEEVLSAIKNFPNKVLISSPNPWVLKKIRALDGNVRLGLIIGTGELHLMPIISFLTRKIDLYSIHPKNVLVYEATMGIFRSSGKKIYSWTVNTEKEFLRMKRLGADAILTDYPELMKKYAR